MTISGYWRQKTHHLYCVPPKPYFLVFGITGQPPLVRWIKYRAFELTNLAITTSVAATNFLGVDLASQMRRLLANARATSVKWKVNHVTTASVKRGGGDLLRKEKRESKRKYFHFFLSSFPYFLTKIEARMHRNIRNVENRADQTGSGNGKRRRRRRKSNYKDWKNKERGN